MKAIADTANSSLILFSLGTNIRSNMLGPERLTIILETFRSLPQYTFLWKFESTASKLPVPIPENVQIRSWLPQTEILAHPNTILFITHSGYLSNFESAWFGVPLLGMPIFADQFSNIDRCVQKGVGKKMFFSDLTQDKFMSLILELSETASYKVASIKLAQNLHDQKESPLERAVWWVEWMLRNPKADHLKSPMIESNVFAQHSIDIISFIVLMAASLLLIFIKITLIVWKCLFHRNVNKKIKQN